MEGKPSQEKLDIEIKYITEQDIGSVRELLVFAAQNLQEAELLGTHLEREKNKRDSVLIEQMCGSGRFALLARIGREPVGIVAARNVEGIWRVTTAYVKPNFRYENIGPKLFATMFSKILEEKGHKIRFMVKKLNQKFITLLNSIGSKILRETPMGSGYVMELDLTDSEVIKNITRLLNAR